MRLKQIDGLRFWASMVIVADHCRVLGLRLQGGAMVSLFFVLSGFFVTKPLKRDGEDRFLSWKGWAEFYVTRIVRIIPLYWGSLFLFDWLFVNAFTRERIFKNMFFLEGWGHLWFLTHEVLCYLLAPALMAAVAFLKKRLGLSNGRIGGGLFVFSILLHVYFYEVTGFRVLMQPFRFDLFVMGASFGYLYKSGALRAVRGRGGRLAADLASLLLILLAHVSGYEVLSRFFPALEGYAVGWERPWLCGFLGGVLVLLLASNPEGLVSRVFSLPWLVRLGKASYGIYILHYYYFIMDPQPFVSPMRNFAANVLCSCCVALVFFEWVEEPLSRQAKKLLSRAFPQREGSRPGKGRGD